MKGQRETDCVFFPNAAGNDDDGEEKPTVPVKTVDKASTRTVKRTADPAPPVRNPGTSGTRRGGAGGNEGGKLISRRKPLDFRSFQRGEKVEWFVEVPIVVRWTNSCVFLAFRDRGAGSDRNHARSTEESARGSGRGGAGARVRGGKLP